MLALDAEAKHPCFPSIAPASSNIPDALISSSSRAVSAIFLETSPSKFVFSSSVSREPFQVVSNSQTAFTIVAPDTWSAPSKANCGSSEIINFPDSEIFSKASPTSWSASRGIWMCGVPMYMCLLFFCIDFYLVGFIACPRRACPCRRIDFVSAGSGPRPLFGRCCLRCPYGL